MYSALSTVVRVLFEMNNSHDSRFVVELLTNAELHAIAYYPINIYNVPHFAVLAIGRITYEFWHVVLPKVDQVSITTTKYNDSKYNSVFIFDGPDFHSKYEEYILDKNETFIEQSFQCIILCVYGKGICDYKRHDRPENFIKNRIIKVQSIKSPLSFPNKPFK